MSTDTIDPPINQISNTAPKFIPIETLIEYANKGLSYPEVAKLVGCSPENVCQRFKTIDYTPERLKDYKKHRADILSHLGSQLINNISHEDIQKAPLGTKVLAYCQLYDKERLERGQSTEIVDLQSVSLDINQLIEQCKAAIPQDIDNDSNMITIEHDND